MIHFRSVFSEVLMPFVMTLVVMTALLMMEKVYRLVSLMVEKRLNAGEVSLMLFYLLPQVLSITLPLAVVGAVFIVIIRQSMDSEVVSLRATGRSLWSYAVPFVVFGALVTALTGAMTLWLQPLASQQYNELQVEMVRWRAEKNIVPGRFNYDFGDKVIRVGGRRAENELNDVFISSRRLEAGDPIVSARLGWIEVDDAAGQVVFRLQDGEVYTPEAGGTRFRTVAFDSLRYVLEYEPVQEVSLRERASLSTPALLRGIRRADREHDRLRLSVELYKRVTLPFSCLAFVLAAIPMAVIDPRSGRSAGYLRAVFLVAAYYVVWAAFKDLVTGGVTRPASLWLPSGLILLYGVLRLWQLNADVESLWRVLRPRPAGGGGRRAGRGGERA